MRRIKKAMAALAEMLLMSWYTFFYYNSGIKNNWILIDSKNGKDLGSNMLRIAEELTNNPDYKEYKLFISYKNEKKKDIQEMIRMYHLEGVKLIKEGKFKFAHVIAVAHFLFTDTTFPTWYAKKEGQVITNSWHGTPLKMMGKEVTDRSYDMGNVQKAHLISDYLLYPSDFMKDVMTSAYFVNQLYEGKFLCSGYPRNSVFLDKERGEKLRRELNLQDKKLYSYMPTWRGNLRNIHSELITDQLEYYFMQLDKSLHDDEIFFVRLHPFVSNNIDYTKYKHIKTFPAGYEPYDILNMCDCMVTDYSSVLFDFANSRKKMVFFVYDKELYMDERGVYVSMETFPYPQVRTVDELLHELRTPKNYDDTEFCEKFCQYDDVDVANKVCRHVIKGEKVCKELTAEKNGKENVLIYAGALAKNGLTTALMSLLANADLDRRNYYLCFRSQSLKRDPLRVTLIPEKCGFIPIPSMRFKNLGETLALRQYYNKNNNSPSVMKKVDRFYKRAYARNLGHGKFDYVIQYAGYEKDITNMFGQAPGKKMIFVHNDMVSEIRTRHNQHELTLRRVYSTFDKVAPVTLDILEPTMELDGKEHNVQIVNNCHDYKSVLEKGEMPLTFDLNTQCTVSMEELQEILDGGAKKFITIGRFSPEKGHKLLLDAFERYHKEDPDSYLIILGGHGELYEQTLAYADSLRAGSHIVIIQSMSNPMPVLKKCSLFLLSSLYEGLGLVILEADTFGIPAIATDIRGPKGFMEEHGGLLVPPTANGLYKGMKAFAKGKVKPMNVDYEKYNQNSVAQFEKLFEGEA